MRYQDWDILLFPDTGTDASAPLPEYRIACVGVDTELGRLPVVHCFIPSMDQGRPFKVSLHRWSTPQWSPQFIGYLQDLLDNQEQPTYNVKVLINGHVMVNEMFRGDLRFPQTINGSMTRGGFLPFPSFHQSTRNRATLEVTNDNGFIKIYITEGLTSKNVQQGTFRPYRHVACFGFMHGPAELLEAKNIAWPNNIILGITAPASRQVPKPNNISTQQTAQFPFQAQVPAFLQGHNNHARFGVGNNGNIGGPAGSYAGFDGSNHESTGSISNNGSFFSNHLNNNNMMPPPPRPYSSLNDMPGSSMYTLSSRSPALAPGFEYTPSVPRQQHTHVGRLASDQLNQILQALSPREHAVAERHGIASTVSLAQVAPPNLVEQDGLRQSSYGLNEITSAAPKDKQPMRQQSYASDISMHPNCNEYPGCIEEGFNNGEFIHNPVSQRMYGDVSLLLDDTKTSRTPSAPQGKKRVSGSRQTEIPRKISKTSRHSSTTMESE